MQTARGLVSDAFVRDNNKLGVVISPDVEPREVKTLAQSLVQGFHKKFPNRDLSVLVYAPDKELILTASYDDTTRQVEYQ
jgi:WD40 repeat protein